MTTTSPATAGPVAIAGATAPATIWREIWSGSDFTDSGEGMRRRPQSRRSITVWARAAACSGESMMVGATTQRSPSAAYGVGVGPVGFVDHEGADPGRIEARHAEHRGLRAEFGHEAVGRTLEGASRDDRGHRDHLVARSLKAASTPGTLSSGPMETIGFEGHTTMRSAAAMASSTPGAGTDVADPSKRTERTATSWWSRTK